MACGNAAVKYISPLVIVKGKTSLLFMDTLLQLPLATQTIYPLHKYWDIEKEKCNIQLHMLGIMYNW